MWVQMKKHFEVRATEWYSALVLSGWGAYTILHPGLYRGPANPYFQSMLEYAPQERWGLAAFMVGFIRITALFINGKWGVTPTVRIATSFVSMLVWFCVSVGLFKSGLPNYGLILYPALLLADAHSSYRAAIDAAEARELKKLHKAAGAENNVRAFRRG